MNTTQEIIRASFAPAASFAALRERSVSIELYNKSCFDFVASLENASVDLVLIDPPYEISRPTNFASGGGVPRFAVSMDFGVWDKNFRGLDIILAEAYRVLRNGGTLICFYDVWKITPLKAEMEKAKFKQIRFIEWEKTNPVPLNSSINYLTGAREVALVGIKKAMPVFNAKYHKGIFHYPIYHNKDRFHPTQKPVELIKELIEIHSREGDLVLDCFAGSGTTALASFNSGRNFVGCELDAVYHEKSVNRLRKNNCDVIESEAQVEA